MSTLLFVLLTELSICSYNVENLLFQPTDGRYYRKLDAIAKVIVDVGQWDYPAVVGIQEVDRDSCMMGLCYRLRNLHYRYIHYDSPDHRGIDVAMLYDSLQFVPLVHYPIPVYLDSVSTTRDILYVKGCLAADSTDCYHLFVCHFPSQLGGAAASEWKRDRAVSTLQRAIDSIKNSDEMAQIIVMGDMNSVPKDNINGLTNLSRIRHSRSEGTHKYHGVWTLLDQFYVSPQLVERADCSIYRAEFLLEDDERYLGEKPRRTNILYHWQNGYSDHLPILLRLK